MVCSLFPYANEVQDVDDSIVWCPHSGFWVDRLPNMSIEEAGLREMKLMKQWQERNAKLMEEANSSWHRDGTRSVTEQDEDAAVEKARAWDDWKDDHPRGAGNKKLTPCG